MLDLALTRAATLADGRLVAVDGPAGSGKTTLAAALEQLSAERDLSCRLLHMDDMYDGWDGLPRVADQLEGLLRPLSRGEVGDYRHYDWEAGRFTHAVEVEPVELLVVEGVGSGARTVGDLATVLVWVEAPHDLRHRRGVERDGPAFAAAWEQWAADEEVLFALEGTRGRADVLVDGTGASAPTAAAR